MASNHAERLARRTASMANTAPAGNPRGHPRAGGAPGRRVDPEPRVEHAEDDNDHRPEDDLGEEEASSLPTRRRSTYRQSSSI